MRGVSEDADFRSTMTLLRQRAALAYRRSQHDRLWQDGYYDRVLRESDDVFALVRYIRDNPVEAGLKEKRTKPPSVWWTTRVDTRSAPL